MLPLSDRLANFIEDFGKARFLQPAANASLSVRLSNFFSDLADCRHDLSSVPAAAAGIADVSDASGAPDAADVSEAAKASGASSATVGSGALPSLDAAALESFLTRLAEPLSKARREVFRLDPWEVAGLGYDEGRHAGVLAWLLNPDGSHGMEHMALAGLLHIVNEHFRAGHGAEFPGAPGRFCRVRTEVYPNGQLQDRVDIEIDAEAYYLIVEVKIMASEQPGQLERYCRQAEIYSRGRPWAVVFLTSTGYAAQSAGTYGDGNRIVALSWSRLAYVLKHELRFLKTKGELADSFSRKMSAYIVGKFLERIRGL